MRMRFPSTRTLLSAFLLISPFVSLCSASIGCLQEDPNQKDSSYDLSPHLQHVSEFSLNLFRELLPSFKGANLFVSPYSVWNALALAYLGAEGGTEEQLRSVLGIKSKVETLKKWRAIDYVYQMRQLQSKGYHFGLVNKAYFQTGMELRQCIHEVLRSELELIDFTEKEDAAETINSFVSNMTENHIKSVTTPSDMEEVQMALVNAAFFRDVWKVPFKKSSTKKDSFFPFNEGAQHVDFMRRKGEFKHGVSNELGAHVLELPYSLKDISMFIFLPPSVEGEKGLEDMLRNLTEISIERAIDEVYYDNLDVAIPKMSLASSVDKPLIEALKRLGVNDVFDPALADLSTFVPNGGVSVTKMMHQSYLEVTEEGTEAAATTVVLGTGRSARPTALRTFVCDHPFMFTIYDKLTKNILFIGVFRNALS